MSGDDMKCLAQEFCADLDAQRAGAEQSDRNLPSREAVATICRRYLEVLFPIYYLWSEGGARGHAHLPTTGGDSDPAFGPDLQCSAV